jgi:hypothetical protein
MFISSKNFQLKQQKRIFLEKRSFTKLYNRKIYLFFSLTRNQSQLPGKNGQGFMLYFG